MARARASSRWRALARAAARLGAGRARRRAAGRSRRTCRTTAASPSCASATTSRRLGGFGGFRRRRQVGPRLSARRAALHEDPRRAHRRSASRTAASNILTLDDPELIKYPVAYLCEAGLLASDRRRGARRCGIICSRAASSSSTTSPRNEWDELRRRRCSACFPELQPMRLTPDDKVFDSFYHITTLELQPSVLSGCRRSSGASTRTTTATKRLLAMINYNNDLSEYWEFSDEGMFPVEHVQRSLQARHQLSHVRAHPLTTRIA